MPQVVPRLVIVAHTPSPATERLTDALERGGRHPDAGPVDVDRRSPFETAPEHLASAAGILLFTTANFGYMSGALKDCFDRCYEPLLGKTHGRPWALVVRGRSDATGAVSSVQRIVTGLKWRAVAEPLTLVGPWRDDFETRCETLGMTLAAGLSMGIF